MVTEYTSEKSAHAHSELENVKKPTVMGTKYAPKKVEVRPVLMVTEYTSEKSAHALSELENVKKPTVMGTKYASKKVEVNRVYF